MESNIKKHRSFLEDRIDTEHGLLDNLYSSEILSCRELRSLRSTVDVGDRSEKLLNCILEKTKGDELMAALRDTGQTHLANYLRADGEYRPEFGDDWPLGEREMKILRINHESLIDIIETCDLCGLLYSKDIINRRQNETISSRLRQTEKNEILLDVLGRISRKKYKTTIECLHSSNQSHIAEILSEGGVVVPIHANAVGFEEGRDISEEEEAIAVGISRLLGDRPLQESDRIFELARLKLIAAKTGQSVVLYFHCRTLKDLTRLMVVLTSGHLQRLVEIAFNDLLSSSSSSVDYIPFALRLDDELYEIGQNYFSVVRRRRIFSRKSKEEKRCSVHANFYELPLEMVDLILTKVCLVSMLSGSEVLIQRRRDENIIRRFASVDECWSKRILRRRFKNRIMRHLSEFYRNVSTRTEFVRNNRGYLSENIRPKGLIDRLRSVDCLTDKESRLIKSQTKHETNKNDELMNIVRSLDVDQYDGFVGQLLRTHQEPPLVRVVARDGGGVVVKATVRIAKTSKFVEVKERLLIQKINKLRREQQTTTTSNSRTREFQKLIEKLKEDEIEILNSVQDSGIAVWFWCQTSNGLRKFQDMRGQLNDGLSELLSDLFECLPLQDRWKLRNVRPKAVNVDVEEILKAINTASIDHRIIFPILIETIKMKESRMISGVTILKNELFGANAFGSYVEVYDSTDFRFKRSWTLEDLVNPWDVVSSARDGCLYFIGWNEKKQSNEILAVDPHGKEMTRWSTGECYGRLSVTRRSNLILTVFDKNKYVEYSPDGRLIRETKLSADVVHPWHAIELTSGQFVVSHGSFSDFLHRVCVVDARGNVLRSFGGERAELNVSSYLAVDEDGSVLAIDQRNSRVLSLSSTLEFKKVVLSKEKFGLRNPCRMFLDRLGGRLFVADNESDPECGWKDGRILIVKIR